MNGVLLHTFVGGIRPYLDLERASEVARAAGKPLFSWLPGREGEIREFKNLARRYGISVYREIRRTVECMAALCKYGETLQKSEKKRVPFSESGFKRERG